MFMHLDPVWAVLAIGSIVVLSFFIGNAVDLILKQDGFGQWGNMIICAAGFFGALYLAPRFGYSLRDIRIAVAFGLGGGFTLLCLLALLKAVFSRFS